MTPDRNVCGEREAVIQRAIGMSRQDYHARSGSIPVATARND
jgi:hypothetical protein